MPTSLEIEIQQLADAHAGLCDGFDCGDADLRAFLVDDAARYASENVAQTFVALSRGSLIGYIALAGDAIRLKPNELKKIGMRWNETYVTVPAVKVARLATVADHQGRGVGKTLMGVAASTLWRVSESMGCRLLTVDAYPDSVSFYEHLGFTRNLHEAHAPKVPEVESNVSMRLDLFATTLPPWV